MMDISARPVILDDTFGCYNRGNHINECAAQVCVNTQGRRLTLNTEVTDMSASSNLPYYPTTEQDDPSPEFDLPRGQMVVRVEDADTINVIFDPPIACVMRDPDGQDRPVRLVNSDDLIARIFAGWQMVEVT